MLGLAHALTLTLTLVLTERSDEPSRLSELRGRVDLGEARLQLQAHLVSVRARVEVLGGVGDGIWGWGWG